MKYKHSLLKDAKFIAMNTFCHYESMESVFLDAEHNMVLNGVNWLSSSNKHQKNIGKYKNSKLLLIFKALWNVNPTYQSNVKVPFNVFQYAVLKGHKLYFTVRNNVFKTRETSVWPLCRAKCIKSTYQDPMINATETLPK